MKCFRWSMSVLVVLTFAVMAVAQDDKPAEMMDEKAMMAMMEKIAAPGEMHKKLDVFAGTWDTEVTSWMAPGAPPTMSKGTSKNSWILGGRYLEQRFEGTFMQKPFSGIGYTGYDNVTKKFVGSWMDSMGTGLMMSEGAMDNDTTWTFMAKMADPMTGQMSDMTEKIIVKDNDHHMFEMWTPGPDGKMFKMMEIAYSRAKK